MNNYDVAIIGSGFVGTSLAHFLQNYFSVKTFDIVSQSSLLTNSKIPHELIDITDFNSLQKIGNPKVIIHSAIIQIPKINEDKNLGYNVNVKGTQNICEIVSQNSSIQGMLLISSWHTYGEQQLKGLLQENIGYRPDMVEDRARLYALSKTIQECLIRFYDEKTPNKIFGALKIGTVLGEGMPKGTAANLFIEKAISGEKLTPFKHSMNRPMLYASITDICKATKNFVNLIIEQKKTSNNSIEHVMNIAYPHPISILDLAHIISNSVNKYTNGKIKPEVSIIDQGLDEVGSSTDKDNIELDVSKVKNFLNMETLTSPQEQIDILIKKKLSTTN
ncbi:NAD-dependent epimerase/dehydratase family protein [Candidatus Nitrosarchaeum limnium]|uniref:NAD dependent epimerase/dehydratase family protein n=1 Tax=Candidatus Nitrosarchaeum limnium BG20 TaxID=859192 RepID=S2E740_9ARCH|nr:NAD(P)-dependent oxidoreductase [Candidatus Nitrosarchaeum limnium]EPA05286.1 NAD dependent epimerase/dehydratase family protein [Candidatus Nitrosarchaeum limnium BG20]